MAATGASSRTKKMDNQPWTWRGVTAPAVVFLSFSLDSYAGKNNNEYVDSILSPPINLFGASVLFLCGVVMVYRGLNFGPTIILLAGAFSIAVSTVIAFQ